MADARRPDISLGSAVFPEYDELYELIASEVAGLTDEQMNFDSDRWEWSCWSIRRQVSHMASLIYRWLLVRWGDELFPGGRHGIADVEGLAQSAFDRRMDETMYFETPVVMHKLREAIRLARGVLSNRTVGWMRSRSIRTALSGQWALMRQAHPVGVTVVQDGNNEIEITLEATFRHMYFEEITHLYNVQRLKRAQGLVAVATLPKGGYWVLEGWDRSEP